jgi:RNA-directed DNA polymerase
MKINLIEKLVAESHINLDLISHAEKNTRNQVRQFKIAKKDSDKFRIIRVPPVEAKLIQKSIVEQLTPLISISKIASAYFSGASIKNNALQHSGKKYLTRLDMKDFFSSIKFDDFRLSLTKRQITLGDNDLRLIELVCFDEGNQLSIGFPASPFISNVVMQEIDNKIIEQISLFENVVCTRYSDDFVVSSNTLNTLIPAIESITKIISSSTSPKLLINHKKTRKMSIMRGNAIVTGVKILDNNKITVHPSIKSDARYLLNLAKKYELDGKKLQQIRGLLSYIKSIDAELFNNLILKNYEAYLRVMESK